MVNPASFFSWSGGKDSMLALHFALEKGYDIHTLFVMMDESGTRSRSHGISPELIKAQAAALDMPLKMARARWDNYEPAFVTCLQEFAKQGICQGIFGDIDLQAHREWDERVCAAAGLGACLPLWGRSRQELAKTFIDLGYTAIVICVNGDVLDSSFTGRPYDAAFLKDLPAGVDMCGENGEFHTFVTAGPYLKYPLSVKVQKIYGREIFSNQSCQKYYYAQLCLQ